MGCATQLSPKQLLDMFGSWSIPGAVLDAPILPQGLEKFMRWCGLIMLVSPRIWVYFQTNFTLCSDIDPSDVSICDVLPLGRCHPMPPVVSDQGFPQNHPVLAPLLFHLWFLWVYCSADATLCDAFKHPAAIILTSRSSSDDNSAGW